MAYNLPLKELCFKLININLHYYFLALPSYTIEPVPLSYRKADNFQNVSLIKSSFLKKCRLSSVSLRKSRQVMARREYIIITSFIGLVLGRP